MMFDFSQLQALFSQIGEEWSPRNKETVCEALWQYYSECNPAQDDRVIQAESALEPYFQGLSPDTGMTCLGRFPNYASAVSVQPFWMACVSPSACTTN